MSEQKFSIYEDIIYQEKEAPESRRKVLAFCLQDQWYALNIMEVEEVFEASTITPLPNVRSFIAGIISLRGHIIPIVDLRILLRPEYAVEEKSGEKNKIAVVRVQDEKVGFLVDSSEESLEIPLSQFQPSPFSLSSEKNNSFIEGHFRYQDKNFTYLNVKKILEQTKL